MEALQNDCRIANSILQNDGFDFPCLSLGPLCGCSSRLDALVVEKKTTQRKDMFIGVY